jgi:hypothetical protein
VIKRERPAERWILSWRKDDADCWISDSAAPGGCALPSPGARVPDPAHEEILVAPLQALRASIPGEVVIDPRIAAYDVRPGRSWPGQQAEAFAAMLGGEVAELEDVVKCSFPWQAQPPVERRCVMKGVGVHLALSRPVVRGDEAGVMAFTFADPRTASLRQRPVASARCIHGRRAVRAPRTAFVVAHVVDRDGRLHYNVVHESSDFRLALRPG